MEWILLRLRRVRSLAQSDCQRAARRVAALHAIKRCALAEEERGRSRDFPGRLGPLRILSKSNVRQLPAVA